MSLRPHMLLTVTQKPFNLAEAIKRSFTLTTTEPFLSLALARLQDGSFLVYLLVKSDRFTCALNMLLFIQFHSLNRRQQAARLMTAKKRLKAVKMLP